MSAGAATGRPGSPAGEAAPPAPREVWGHPIGLGVLAGTELWDRISFHGMQAMLVLYMVERLLLPGHIEHVAGFAGFRAAIEAVTGPLSTQALASQIFGLYIGLVYLTPVLGGLLGDRLLGRRRAVALGALLMTAGHFCMAFERSFLAALLLLILGAGCLRGNLASQLGDLYARTDPRRDTAFQIYYAMLNTGAFVAPLISGALGQAYGWDVAFGFAGVGMLLGLILYLAGQHFLPRDGAHPDEPAPAALDPAQRRVVRSLLLLLPSAVLFWIAQSQIWNTYNVWARDHVDLVVGGWHMPVPWLQAVDALGVVVLMPLVLAFWRRQAARAREPDAFAKLGLGCLLFGAAVAWLACGDLVADAAGKVPLAWALAYHFLSAIGYLYWAPSIVALFSCTAPRAVNAMMIGVYFLAIFAGSTLGGRLGALYETLSPLQFWLLHAALCAGGGLLVFVLAPRLRSDLAPGPGETAPAPVPAA
jgi:POT family proton-dependent oligopeptide transporter